MMTKGTLIGLAACAIAAGGCHTHVDARTQHGVPQTQVVADSGSYAAMDEIPVSGGELRLVEEIEIEIDVEAGLGGTETARAIAFPLASTDVSADVSGGIAVTTIEQLFRNPYEQPLEAVYVFPLGDEAAVVGYEIVIGDRTVAGEIDTREQARRTYEEAKRSGHTAALVEQEKPNVFAQRVANIPPGQEVTVRFQVVEMLDYADGQWQLALPTTVGPRYLPAGRTGDRPVGAHHAGGTGRPGVTSVPYADAEELAHRFTFRARIEAGLPVAEVDSPTHRLELTQQAPTSFRVTTPPGQTDLPNRDLVLRYRTAGQKTLVGLATHREADGPGYFTLTVQPKQRYRTGDIVPRDVAILIDVSGSMDGAPLEQARAIARAIIETLGDRDVFNVITFASGTTRMRPGPVPGDRGGRSTGALFVDGLRAAGGTEMESAVLEVLRMPSTAGRLRTVYLVSDAFVGNDDVILEAAESARGSSRIFPVGVGSSPNRHLIERLAEVGRGSASYILPGEDAGEVVTRLVRRSAYPYLTGISIDWGGLDVTDVTPAVLPDVQAGTPLVIAGRYRKPGKGTVTVTGTAAGRVVSIPVEVALPTEADRPAVRYAWARKRVTELTSPASRRRMGDGEIERAVTAIGLEHHMVTDYTSFVAVDRTRVVDGAGNARTVEQPAAVPSGVDAEMAVGPAEPAPAPRRSSSGSSGGGWGWGGGGGGGGGDVDPLTLAILLLMIPAILALRRQRTP